MRIVIIGGGASGMMLAHLFNKDSFQVTLLEKEEHIGKKLLLTGNGKCNFSNVNIERNNYNQALGFEIAASFDANQHFKEMGLLTVCDEQGRYYPLSMTSNTLLDLLRFDCNNINILCNQTVIKIQKEKNIYRIYTNKKDVFEADILVLACGGKTYYKESNGYQLASMLSMHITPLRPSLIGLRVNQSLASIANLRSKARVTLLADKKKIFEDEGEILWKNDGLSGIVVFQISSMMNRNPFLNYEISVDLLPSMSEEEIKNHLQTYHSLNGFFAKMLNQFILKRANSQDPYQIAYTIKHLTFSVLDTYDFKNAQVTSGGVSVKDVDANLESRYNPNCYVMGEMLDVDGICGGYNLQFAFASASRVYQAIKQKIKKEQS